MSNAIDEHRLNTYRGQDGKTFLRCPFCDTFRLKEHFRFPDTDLRDGCSHCRQEKDADNDKNDQQSTKTCGKCSGIHCLGKLPLLDPIWEMSKGKLRLLDDIDTWRLRMHWSCADELEDLHDRYKWPKEWSPSEIAGLASEGNRGCPPELDEGAKVWVKTSKHLKQAQLVGRFYDSVTHDIRILHGNVPEKRKFEPVDVHAPLLAPEMMSKLEKAKVCKEWNMRECNKDGIACKLFHLCYWCGNSHKATACWLGYCQLQKNTIKRKAGDAIEDQEANRCRVREWHAKMN